MCFYEHVWVLQRVKNSRKKLWAGFLWFYNSDLVALTTSVFASMVSRTESMTKTTSCGYPTNFNLQDCIE